MSKRAVLMMTFGSPEDITYEGVAEFFTNIRRGVRPEPHEIQTLYDHYLRIGGTPLQRITKKEVDLVASALGEQVSVYFANKFSRPFITDVIKEMENDGIEECLCLILEPHYSYYSVMGYEKFLASDIEASINQWLSQVPSHLFKSITFDCGKEFSNWKSISNAHDIDIFFANPGCPEQRGLNEHSNGLLRRNGLPKQIDFTNISQNYLSATADKRKRKRLPRKSLNYQTPYQVFLSYMKNLT